ncbi:SDR family oxidoreductase [Paenibacillus gansuensis]|uniref:SDR family oxidoreductase n=1 Tax=Paenibacillus gansuensis TaxID=306542 RepID=A0ABW5PFJ8_9BACL
MSSSNNSSSSTQTLPPQHQERQPGLQSDMTPKPDAISEKYKGSGKLQGKVALITGGDSGIGRSAAVCYAAEGANVAVVYLDENGDAEETKRLIEAEGAKCLLLAGDIGDEQFCKQAVQKTVDEFGKLDILVNNAAEQHPQKSIEDITQDQLEKTFRTNIFSMFYLTKAALPHLKEGSSIINTTSITAYKGSPQLLDYSSTKGAIVAFTRSLSGSLIERGIRVNGIAPGPIWTPLIPSTFDEKQVSEFGGTTPMKRPGRPEELGPAYVFLASSDSSYMAGQILHINGGEIVNG